MKKFIITSLSLLIAIAAFAQSGDAISSFLKKYSQGSTASWCGKQMPHYYFNAQLNSNKLKGKIVLLDYWATWCGACHSLGEDLNAKLKGKNFPENTQIIGVNNEGTSVKNKISPANYWKKNKMSYPMVEGTKAIRCCQAVKSGYPTLILIDGKGIVRARWDTYTPQIADMAELVIWALGEGETLFTQQDFFDCVNGQDYLKALYICEQLAPSEYDAASKLRCILHVSEGTGIDYAKPAYQSAKENMSAKDFDELQNDMFAAIVESKVLSVDMNRFGIKIAEDMCAVTPGYADNYIFTDYKGRLYWRIGQKEKAQECASKCLKLSKDNNAAPETITYFEKVLKSYKEEKGEGISKTH